jgi:phospholipase A1/A2
MKLLVSFLLLVEILIASTEFEDAYVIYQSGDFKTSFEKFKKLAQKDHDTDAAYILATMYEYGMGCNVDIQKANEWYKFSAQEHYYAGMNDSSRHIDKEYNKIYRSLSDFGDVDTQGTIQKFAESLYNVKSHKINYFLPLSYRYDEHYPQVNEHQTGKIEAEFQFSIKYDFTANLLGLDEIYGFGYTQLSFWQFYQKSAFFRETNYNPEVYVIFPLAEYLSKKVLKGLKISFAHQSNGRGGEEERSWNYVSLSGYFQYKFLFMDLTFWHRLPDNTDYNPELIDYMGHGHLRFMLPYKKHMTQMILKSNFEGSSSIEVNYSYPVSSRDDLFLFIKGFSGYGESLIDYNHNLTKIGIGFSISR